jgi:hypothetical protein
MGMLRFEVGHSLPKDEARRRTEALLRYWSQKYGLQAQWKGDSATLEGKVMGLTLHGALSVSEAKVDGEATDPGLLLRDRARKYLTRKFTAYLAAGADPTELEKD